eukprot:4604987-Alexandrium_andersonii.AAC.1
MSASLVGSEMCIRDRKGDVRGGLELRRDPTVGTPGCVPKLGDGSLDPVSYTHLTLPTICSV